MSEERPTIPLTQAQFRGGPWDGADFPVPDPPCPKFMVARRAEDGAKAWHAYKWSPAMGLYIYEGVKDVGRS